MLHNQFKCVLLIGVKKILIKNCAEDINLQLSSWSQSSRVSIEAGGPLRDFFHGVVAAL